MREIQQHMRLIQKYARCKKPDQKLAKMWNLRINQIRKADRHKRSSIRTASSKGRCLDRASAKVGSSDRSEQLPSRNSSWKCNNLPDNWSNGNELIRLRPIVTSVRDVSYADAEPDRLRLLGSKLEQWEVQQKVFTQSKSLTPLSSSPINHKACDIPFPLTPKSPITKAELASSNHDGSINLLNPHIDNIPRRKTMSREPANFSLKKVTSGARKGLSLGCNLCGSTEIIASKKSEKLKTAKRDNITKKLIPRSANRLPERRNDWSERGAVNFPLGFKTVFLKMKRQNLNKQSEIGLTFKSLRAYNLLESNQFKETKATEHSKIKSVDTEHTSEIYPGSSASNHELHITFDQCAEIADVLSSDAITLTKLATIMKPFSAMTSTIQENPKSYPYVNSSSLKDDECTALLRSYDGSCIDKVSSRRSRVLKKSGKKIQPIEPYDFKDIKSSRRETRLPKKSVLSSKLCGVDTEGKTVSPYDAESSAQGDSYYICSTDHTPSQMWRLINVASGTLPRNKCFDGTAQVERSGEPIKIEKLDSTSLKTEQKQTLSSLSGRNADQLNKDEKDDYSFSTLSLSPARKRILRRKKNVRRKTARISGHLCLLPTGVQGKVRESVAMVIVSKNPYKDFRKSMMEMILVKELKKSSDLEALLQCYLSLNAPCFSELIAEVFIEIWFQIFHKS